MTNPVETTRFLADPDVLDMALTEVPIAFVDLELTGLDPRQDAIVEVAVVRRRARQTEAVFSSAIRAPRAVSTAAREAVGLAHLDGGAAVAMSDACASFEPLLRGALVVGHGIDLDREMLTRALADANVPMVRADVWIDTWTLARRAFAADSYRLGALAETLGLVARNWHRALDDALGVVDLFDRAVSALDARTGRELREVQVGQRGRVLARSRIAQRLTALAASRAAVSLVVRTPGRSERRLVGEIERWTPPHAAVLEHRAGGLHLVRADRILRIEEAPDRAFDDGATGASTGR